MEEVRENKMGTQPIGDLLFKMSLPIMISMLVQALYNIVDSIFVVSTHCCQNHLVKRTSNKPTAPPITAFSSAL